MKSISIIILILIGISAFAQIDRDQLALDVSKAEDANMEQLKSFIWKQESVVTVDGEEKLTVLNEFSIDEEGKVSVTNLDSDTDVKQKRGIRGRIQANVAEDNLDYVEHALELAVNYMFMTKGQLIDYFDKAEMTEKEGVIHATAANIFIKGDNLTVKVDKETKLFLHKEFSTLMDQDPVSGEIVYDTFTSGISHASTSVLKLPAKNAVISSKNKDYVQKIR